MQPEPQIAHELLTQRLAHIVGFSDTEVELLGALLSGPQRTLGARRDLVREGDPPRLAYLLTGGWATRYKMLEDGRRQTLAFLLPGDLCDVSNSALREMDHSIGAITPISFVEVGYDRLEQLAGAHPRLARAFTWQLLTNLSIQREWTLNLGRRSALERIGHLLCEIVVRLRSMGLSDDHGCDLPLTQNDISEATGLTPVHVNRTLQDMRMRGLIVLKGRRLDIPDLGRLQQVALFSDTYLHLHRGDASPAAAV